MTDPDSIPPLDQAKPVIPRRLADEGSREGDTVESCPRSLVGKPPRDDAGSASTEPEAPEPKGPFPRRFWWLKRLCAAAFALALALLGLRMWWGHVADRRLRAALDHVAARGEPVRVGDLERPRLDDEVNVATYLKRAATSVNPTAYSPANTAIDETAAYAPWTPKWHEVAGAAVAANGPTFAAARRARAFDRTEWGPPGALLFNPGPLNEVRTLANTLADGALYAHERGDDVAALEAIRDVRHAAGAVGVHPLVINNLVSIGIDSLAMVRLAQIATGLRISEDDAPAASLRGAWAGERLSSLAASRTDAGQSWLVRPMFRLDEVRVIKLFDTLIDASAEPTWPAARALLIRSGMPPPPTGPKLPGSTAPPRDWSRLFSGILLGGVGGGRTLEHNYRATTERRMVAVKLAAALYRADHGAWPPSIEVLVPNYLPEPPRDAVSNDNTPLRYLVIPGGLPDGADRPLVYSAGPNGAYDTRGPQSIPNEPIYSWYRGPDEWRDLARWAPPATAPSTQHSGTQ